MTTKNTQKLSNKARHTGTITNTRPFHVPVLFSLGPLAPPSWKLAMPPSVDVHVLWQRGRYFLFFITQYSSCGGRGRHPAGDVQMPGRPRRDRRRWLMRSGWNFWRCNYEQPIYVWITSNIVVSIIHVRWPRVCFGVNPSRIVHGIVDLHAATAGLAGFFTDALYTSTTYSRHRNECCDSGDFVDATIIVICIHADRDVICCLLTYSNQSINQS